VGLVKVLSPDAEPELIAVVAMLEAHSIPCFVQNAGFGSLYPGPQIGAFNARAIMVPEEKAAEALELIGDFQAGGPRRE
jgi:hypothetical protein